MVPLLRLPEKSAADGAKVPREDGMTKSGWLLPGMLALSAGPALAAALPDDLAQAAKAYEQAQVHPDPAALERLLADDYLLVNGAGATETKAQFIHDLTDPDIRQDPFTVADAVERVWGDGAVLGGTTLFSGSDHGKPFSAKIRFVDVWARRGGRWQVVYTQVSRAP
jgi:hypothetical protein